ncbi:MAG TPA: hypothetical protein PK777_02940, partial [Thermoguttaceae bacterium]|nr:hypothetical protein [Thermoguttaceae bacterium]
MKGLLRTGLVVCAVGLMLYAPVVCRAGEASASARQTETQPDGKLLDYIPPQATAALAAHPHRVFTSPEWDMFPREILTAQGKQSLGFDPVQITSILVVLEMELPNPPQLV